MTTSQLLDLVLNHFVTIGTSDLTNSTWRARALERAQEVVEEFWNESDWDFKASSTTLSVVANDTSVAAPADLATIGENGGLFISGEQEKLKYRAPSLLLLDYESSSGTARPSSYAVISQNASYVPLIHFDSASDASYTLNLYYDTTAPALLDAPGAPNCTATVGAGLSIGAYRYKYTFLAGSIEGEVSPYQTVTTTALNSQVTLGIGTSDSSLVTARKIYRTVVAGTTTYKLVTTISDNTTTAYVDSTADASLGATAPTGSNLSRIPQEMHRSVLQIGLKARLAKDFNDSRAMEYEAQFQQAMAKAKSRRVAGIEDDERILEDGIASWMMW